MRLVVVEFMTLDGVMEAPGFEEHCAGDLATGTDLDFRSLGSVALRGVPKQWELFAASLRSAPSD